MRRKISLVLIYCVMMAAQGLIAQEKKEPERRDISIPVDSSTLSKKQLPSIELPEFLITGKEAIDLPEFSKSIIDEKQPSLANTSKRSAGNREGARIVLGASTKEQASIGQHERGLNGKVLAGFGSYSTPFFDGWFGQSYPGGDFLLRAGYESSSGHIVNSDYRNGNGSIEGGLQLSEDFSLAPEGEVRGGFRFDGQSYRPYGSIFAERERTLSNFGSFVVLSSSPYDAFTFDAGIHVETSSLRDSLKTRETLLGVKFNSRQSWADFDLLGSASIWISSFSTVVPFENPYFTRLRIAGKYRVAPTFDVQGGFSLFGFRGSDTKNRGRVFPELGLYWRPADRFSLFAKFDPGVEKTTLNDLVKKNPYIETQSHVRHTEVIQSYAVGFTADIGSRIRSRVTLRSENSQQVPIFVDSVRIGLWKPHYSGTSTIRAVDAEFSVRVSEADNLGVTLTIQDTKNSITGKALPYYPSLNFAGVYSYRFPFHLTLSLNWELLSKRYADQANSMTLKEIPYVGFDAEYEILKNFIVFLNLKNVTSSDQQRFDRYQGRPFTASVGAGFSW